MRKHLGKMEMQPAASLLRPSTPPVLMNLRSTRQPVRVAARRVRVGERRGKCCQRWRGSVFRRGHSLSHKVKPAFHPTSGDYFRNDIDIYLRNEIT